MALRRAGDDQIDVDDAIQRSNGRRLQRVEQGIYAGKRSISTGFLDALGSVARRIVKVRKEVDGISQLCMASGWRA